MKVFGLARLTKEPEYHNGTTKFSIAWNHWNGDSQFFNCVAFKKQAEQIYNTVHKGHRIVIYGQLVNNHWTDKEGTKHYNEQIIVNQFEYIESKNTEPHIDTPFKNDDQKKYEELSVEDINEQLPF